MAIAQMIVVDENGTLTYWRHVQDRAGVVHTVRAREDGSLTRRTVCGERVRGGWRAVYKLEEGATRCSVCSRFRGGEQP